MTSSERMDRAAILARAIISYGLPLVASAAVSSAGEDHYVRIEMVDGLSFNLPWDFNPEHFDTIIAVASVARVKGREEALLELLPSDSKAH